MAKFKVGQCWYDPADAEYIWIIEIDDTREAYEYKVLCKSMMFKKTEIYVTDVNLYACSDLERMRHLDLKHLLSEAT